MQQSKVQYNTIPTYGDESGRAPLQHWVLEKDHVQEWWRVFNDHRRDSQPNGKCRIVTFHMRNRLRIPKIRLWQIGTNHRREAMPLFSESRLCADLFRHSSRK
jgi:hypothetical protein